MLNKKKTYLIIAVTMIFIISGCTAYASNDISKLSADVVSYNSKTGMAIASGNVIVTKGTSIIRGETGNGDLNLSYFTMTGNVRGTFKEQGISIESDVLNYKKLTKHGLVTAKKNVHLTRENGDDLHCDYLSWETETENYKASGNVVGVTPKYIVKAAMIERTLDDIHAVNVTRFVDKHRNVTLSAEKIRGKLKDDALEKATADGNVVVRFTDEKGFKTVITGANLVYECNTGTAIMTGNPVATRSDGKRIKADKLIFYEKSGRVEALGNSNIYMIVDDKKSANKTENPSENNKN